jgi:hypothetical protein
LFDTTKIIELLFAKKNYRAISQQSDKSEPNPKFQTILEQTNGCLDGSYDSLDWLRKIWLEF